MRALGLDPGSAITGYGVVEGRGNRLRHIAHGVIRTSPSDTMPQRLQVLYHRTLELMQTYSPDAVAIERLFFKQNVSTGITVAQARGVLLLAAVQTSLPISEFSPTEMKVAVTGYGRADKMQLQEMVKRLLSLDAVPKPDDAADALALAICRIQIGHLPPAK
jgi:crossover junction endodeoxyribonuclease RuvC